nr:14 kDa phosphohistidine phosphatase [Chelonoidis abingdonii]
MRSWKRPRSQAPPDSPRMDPSMELTQQPVPALPIQIHTTAIRPADIYDKTAAEIEKQGYDCECLGGGRISHQSKEKKIHVYGYSVGFGRAKHSVSTKILKDEYPDYAVTWADEGY